jgi:hypothetical protein
MKFIEAWNHIDHVDAWLCLVGMIFVGHGAYGVAKKRIKKKKGKFGPTKLYTGREAVVEGILSIVWGLFFVVFGLVNMMHESK